MGKTNTFEVKDEKITLSSYYNQLPPFEKRPLVNKICEICDVTMTTAYNWISGRNKPIKASYFHKISELTGIPAENLFPAD